MVPLVPNSAGCPARSRLALALTMLVAAGVLVSCGRGGEYGAGSGGGPSGAAVDSAALAAGSQVALTDSALALRPYANPLLEDIRRVFRVENPQIAQVAILEARSFKDPGRNPTILIGWGIRADHTFHGDWNDELFGVFAADDSLTHVVRVFDIFPTSDWLDEEVGFLGNPLIGAIRIYARGGTHGEDLGQRSYSWMQGKPPVPEGTTLPKRRTP